VLGVAKDASQKAIKDAFRDLALKYHPDRNKGAGAEERFKDIAEAYAILSDPQKRADYDARGFAGVAGYSSENLFGGIDFEEILGGLHFGFGDRSPFEAFFGRQRAGPRRGANIEVDLPVTLERIAGGGEEEMHLSRPTSCPACHGSGEEGGAAPAKCKDCAGTGRITRSRREDKEHVLIQQISTCSACHGRGFKLEHPCPQCQGRGEVEQEESLTVKIPVGAEEGLPLRIPGKGMPSPDARGVAGDLFALVRTQPDARFQRAGADLLRIESILLTDAVLGTTLDVPTLEGSARVTVPPGMQPNAVLRLKDKGLPAFGDGPHGDLYLRIEVQVPDHLEREELALYQQLRALQAGKKEG
jgi:molecular chaperone DnaJ